MATAPKLVPIAGARPKLLNFVHPCTVAAEGQRVRESGGVLARRRFQKGQLVAEERRDESGRIDKDRSVWLGRWREDEIRNGRVQRVRRKCVLGTFRELATKKLPERALQEHIDRAAVNNPTYRPRVAATFGDLANRWESTVLAQLKPSTQVNFRSHLAKYVKPHFGGMALRDINTEAVQQFVASIHASPKTARNIIATFRVVWSSARAWTYVQHDPFAALRLPRGSRSRQFCFTEEEARRIIAAAKEPYRTFYRLAFETGMRAGELCGLRVDDLDLENCLMRVNQSVWRGRLLDPKTFSGTRSIGISPQLAQHLRSSLLTWRPNERRLL